jgi:hypothetical protein
MKYISFSKSDLSRPGPNLDRTFRGLRCGPGPGFSGPDLEVQVHGPQILPGPDPDPTVDSVLVHTIQHHDGPDFYMDDS